MEANKHQSEKYIRAQNRVKQIKQFYKHLKIYIIVNILLLIVKFRLFDFFTNKGVQDEGFYDWLEWNTIGTPIVWGIGLFLHGIYVFKWQQFKPNFMKDWEAKQMTKFLEEENQKESDFKK